MVNAFIDSSERTRVRRKSSRLFASGMSVLGVLAIGCGSDAPSGPAYTERGKPDQLTIPLPTITLPQINCNTPLIPPPKDLNVCRTLVEDLILPPVITAQPSCTVSGAECIFLPHCCVPGVCLTFPECVTTKQVSEGVKILAHSGEVYCGPQEITPEHFLQDLENNRFPDLTTLSTGGINSVLFTVAGSYIDGLECKAPALPDSVKNAARVVMSMQGFPGLFGDSEIDRAHILPKRESGVLDLPKDGYGAITLDSLILLTDAQYDALMSDDFSYDRVAQGRATADQTAAFFTIMHELVHVRQYRELGREQFLNNYLPDAVVNGYSGVAFELEAYSLSGHCDGWLETMLPGSDPQCSRFAFSSNGAVPGYHCVSVNEGSDPDHWEDNYFCTDSDEGMQWSSVGAIPDMQCIQIVEGADPNTWDDNYLCWPGTQYTDGVSWSSAGAAPGKNYSQWDEGSDPDSWSDNFLSFDDRPRFKFSSHGDISGYHCVSVNEGSDPDAWADNFFCSADDEGMQWSSTGTIAGAACIQISEPSDPNAWDDNYLCFSNGSYLYNMQWSPTGRVLGKKCVAWAEDSDPDTWQDNYLCF
jgi:hypothetical protein